MAQRNSKGQFVKGSGRKAAAAPAARTRTRTRTVAVTAARPATRRAAARRSKRYSMSEIALAGLGGAVAGYAAGSWLQSAAGVKALEEGKGSATKEPSGVLKYGTGLPLLAAGAGLTYVLPDRYKLLGVVVVGAGAVMVGLRASAKEDATGKKAYPQVSGRTRTEGPDLRGLAAMDRAVAGPDDDDDDVAGPDDDDDDVGYDDDDDGVGYDDDEE